MTMVAFKARHREELEQICKEYKITMWPSTIDWWLKYHRHTNEYLCIDVEKGIQRGGGYADIESELGKTTILTTRRRLI